MLHQIQFSQPWTYYGILSTFGINRISKDWDKLRSITLPTKLGSKIIVTKLHLGYCG